MDTNLPTELIREHYAQPHNTTLLETVTHTGKAENMYCGDTVTIKLLVLNNIIKEICVVAEGCSLCVASASLWSDKVKNMKLNQVQVLTPDDILKPFNVTQEHHRAKCLLLILDALKSVNAVN